MKKLKECEHEFKYKKGWRKELRLKEEIIEIPQKCINCGLECNEVWSYSCVTDDNGNTIQN